MEYVWIGLAVFVGITLVMNLLPEKKEKKPPSGNCRNCPEFQYCGGGRRGCGRRGEIKK